MALNYIWIGFFVIAFVFGIISLLMGDTTIFEKMMNSTFDSSKNAFTTSIGLTGVLTLWLGIMKIGEKAGVVNVLARMLSPFSQSSSLIFLRITCYGFYLYEYSIDMLGMTCSYA